MNDGLLIASKIGNTFVFNGKKLFYFLHPYNKTWRNERSIEIPIVRHLIKDIDGKTLEVGNVTQNYYNQDYDIIDKYEKWPRVINKDIITYDTQIKYQKIIAISTIEHCGEDINDPREGVRAIEKLKTLLSTDGIMVLTIPAGFNKTLQKYLPKLGMKIYAFKQIQYGLWEQCSLEEIADVEYDRQNHTALGLYVCVYKK